MEDSILDSSQQNNNPSMPSDQAQQVSLPQENLPWLTWTNFLLALIIGLAACLRLLNLDHFPLVGSEAPQSWLAYQALQGELPTSNAYSPLLFGLNNLSLLLFGATEVSLRLGPALLGLVFVVLPWWIRAEIGTDRALLSSFFLALSATSLFWSRLNYAYIGVALGAMLIFVGLIRYFRLSQISGIYASCFGIVLLLLSGPAGFSALLVALLIGLFFYVTNRSVFINTLTLWRETSLPKSLALFSGGSLLLLGSTALFNLQGLATISSAFSQWLAQFSLLPQAGASYPAILLLILYEPFLLIFGLAGLGIAFLQRDRLDWVLSVWLGLALIVDTLMGGRDGGQVLLVLIPLVFLASRSVHLCLEHLYRYARLDSDGLLIGIVLVISGFIYVTLTRWAFCRTPGAGCDENNWILPVAGLILILILLAVFMVWYGWAMALRCLGFVLLICVGLFAAGQTWRLNFGSIENLAFQVMLADVPASEGNLLWQDLERESFERRGDAFDLDLAVLALDAPLIRWHLRFFDQAQFVSGFPGAVGRPLILAAPGNNKPLGDYLGQSITLSKRWSPLGLSRKDTLRWYLFRELPQQDFETSDIHYWRIQP